MAAVEIGSCVVRPHRCLAPVRDMTPRVKPCQQGFTLMELMIVVAIVAILAAVALPAYQDSVTKTWRNKATSCLTEMAQSMERRFTGAMSYDVPAGARELPPNTCTTDDGMAARYAFSFDGELNDAVFTLQAEPQGVQAANDGSRCGTLRITETGLRTASVDDEVVQGGRCW